MRLRGALLRRLAARGVLVGRPRSDAGLLRTAVPCPPGTVLVIGVDPVLATRALRVAVDAVGTDPLVPEVGIVTDWSAVAPALPPRTWDTVLMGAERNRWPTPAQLAAAHSVAGRVLVLADRRTAAGRVLARRGRRVLVEP